MKDKNKRARPQKVVPHAPQTQFHAPQKRFVPTSARGANEEKKRRNGIYKHEVNKNKEWPKKTILYFQKKRVWAFINVPGTYGEELSTKENEAQKTSERGVRFKSRIPHSGHQLQARFPSKGVEIRRRLIRYTLHRKKIFLQLYSCVVSLA